MDRKVPFEKWMENSDRDGKYVVINRCYPESKTYVCYFCNLCDSSANQDFYRICQSSVRLVPIDLNLIQIFYHNPDRLDEKIIMCGKCAGTVFHLFQIDLTSDKLGMRLFSLAQSIVYGQLYWRSLRTNPRKKLFKMQMLSKIYQRGVELRTHKE